MARLTVELRDVSTLHDLERFAALLNLLGCNEDHPVSVCIGGYLSASTGLDFIDLPGDEPDDTEED